MKQFDMRHIGLFDINFDTGEQYRSCELRRILRLPETGTPDLSILLKSVDPDDRAAVLALAMQPFQESVRPIARSSGRMPTREEMVEIPDSTPTPTPDSR